MKSTPWSVGELAERFGLATHVLRHWEDMGLLAPERDGAGRRRYGEADAYRVAVIVASKAAGMSLEKIRALVDSSARARHRILEAHLADIDERMVALERSRRMARHALECEAHDISMCPNFRANVADIVTGARVGMSLPGPPRGHAHPAS
ncbi:MerR family transcriptional regulator [Microbacterium sp. NPDC096154]|uniref:MerR family transcriptional regulator n=1 Tax=Microbacterium sp. NPDC096154 TaxID=3155549 RepID=UPI0033200C81